MNQTDDDFSTQKITPQLVGQIVEALKNKAYGSVEIYVENYNVTQITERTINKVASSFRQRRFHLIKKNGHSERIVNPIEPTLSK